MPMQPSHHSSRSPADAADARLSGAADPPAAEHRHPGHKSDNSSHGHHHRRSHAHHHHAHHDHARGADEHRILLAALLTGAFMVAEVAGGIISGSLALIADAGHMLTDFGSLSLAWFGFRLARRPADWKRTYGFDRFSVLVAFVNAAALIALAVWILVEAILRLREPVEVLGLPMLAVAAGGLAVNLGVFLVLRGSGGGNLNMRAATLHVMGDMLGSVAAIAAAAVVLVTGWTPIDPLLSMLVAGIIVRSGWRVLAESGHILLEASPAGLDIRELRSDLIANIPGVEDVHHVHAWSLSEERAMVTLHARLASGDPDAAVAAIKSRLQHRFGIGHATVELEHGACADA
jgi:cobalt-zinc-cadmium efflux system protein